ncbi:soluble quino protein glucose/sorbosone dehydrogenase, partial [Staphylotrichum tortipilum]
MASLFKSVAATAVALLLACGAEAQDTTTTTSSSPSACATVLKPSYSAPVVADGWKAQLIATDLSRPRGLKFDTKGALLVIESGVGLKHLTFTDNGGTCLSVKSSKTVITDKDLNHGLELSQDGKTLYVSSASTVFSYTYDPDTISATNPTRLITNMSHPSGGGHVTRTLLLSKKHPSHLLVSRGSASNLDLPSLTESSGVSQIRVFNISSEASSSFPYDYPTGGVLLARGLRNSVGVAEHPSTGGIWSVENSADNVARGGRDVHEDNPGEELNAHGPVPTTTNDNNNTPNNYGYPTCFALWSPSSAPSFSTLPVGTQFALDPANDTLCAAMTPPRLTFPAHTAPLDLKFPPTKNGSVEEAFITFHGSWNRAAPAGYKLSILSFSPSSGEPVAQRDSIDALRDVMSAPDVGVCGGREGGCMRPVGMAFDAAGRLWVASDATGEVWVVMRGGEGGEGG